MNTERATFAAGCFWGVEAAFSQIKGVVRTTVGYTGGITKNPTYKTVCSGTTGHAEAVEVEYNPEQVTYDRLLDLFWKIHNPTSFNRQGPDVGYQYRSAIFYHGAQQQDQARSSMEKLGTSGTVSGPIVTQLAAATEFYAAEEYHQKYYEKHGGKSCHLY